MDVEDSKSQSREKMKEKKDWIIRPMRFDDIDKCLIIWSRVELTEAHQTVASCLAADPEGFYVAELNNSGEVVGMCAANLVKPDTAFVGFYGVEPHFQGIGIGRELWSKCFERLNIDPLINVGLYGVPNMTEKYKRIGFKLEDSIRMIIYESERNNEHNLNLNFLKSTEDLPSDCRLEIINKNTAKSIRKSLIEYDETIHKFSREKLLQIYLFDEDAPLTFAIVKTSKFGTSGRDYCLEQNQLPGSGSSPNTKKHFSTSSNTSSAIHHHHNPTSGAGGERKSSCCARPPNQEAIIEDEALSTTTKNTLSISASSLGDLQLKSEAPIEVPSRTVSSGAGLTQASQQQEEILGYGIIRNDNNLGGIIGPIYADSSEFCEVLLRALIENFSLTPGSIYSLMALDSNQKACKLMEKVGFKEIDQCTRMFTKQIPTASFQKVYFVHSPNFTIV